MKLSVCLIVKNEEQYLGRCLESIAPYADEIIITDT
jgi:glycosyltransferase involved in cell wall biosynthesis